MDALNGSPGARRLDVRGLARSAATLEGTLAQDAFERLCSGLPAVLAVLADARVPAVRWSARGEWRPAAGAEPEIWLHLQATTEVALICQRCLLPMTEPLAVQRSFRFVANEEEAARLDEDSDDDVLALPRLFDLLELLEDELILALPIVPRHASCPQPLVVAGLHSPPGPQEPQEPTQHPFAALAALRRPPAG